MREELAQNVYRFKERGFTEKLQKFLHDPRCGKHSLHYLNISSKLGKNPCKYQWQKCKIPVIQASLKVSPRGYGHGSYIDCQYPQTEMPENITKFKQLSIGYLDDQVIDFLAKLKPIFTNVFLDIRSLKSAPNVRILFGHLLPMLDSIRGIACNHIDFEILTADYPGLLGLAKGLHLEVAKPAFIPAYLEWLNAPLDFDLDGPRFFEAFAKSETIFAIIDAQFLAAITSASTFVVFLQFYQYEQHLRTDELMIENAATNEKLVMRNAVFKIPNGNIIHYVEIVRHPTGADAIIRDWIKGRAYYEKIYNSNDEAERKISIDGWPEGLTIGKITKKVGARGIDQCEADEDQDKAGPSTTAKKMKK